MTTAADSAFDVDFPAHAIAFRFSNHGYLDHIANLVQQNGLAAYEAPTPSLFAALCREARGLVLDVGANTGLFTLLAAAANPAIQVCAFEPLPGVFSLLEANIGLNPALAPRIALQRIGLSRASGQVTFYETINDAGLITTSSSIEVRHASEIGQYREQTIETSSLDEWSERLGPAPVQFMKMDVEGHEHAVIEGGRRFLARHRPYVTAEVLGPAEKRPIQDFLLEAGYLDFAIAPGVLRHCASIRFHPDAWNHLLCPTERAGRLLSVCRDIGLQIHID